MNNLNYSIFIFNFVAELLHNNRESWNITAYVG